MFHLDLGELHLCKSGASVGVYGLTRVNVVVACEGLEVWQEEPGEE